jgi:hypothetical protein
MTTKMFSEMKGVNSKLSELKATTAELSLAEKRQLLESLSEDISAAAVAGPKKRLAAVSAAAVSTNQRTKEAYKHAVKGLECLGLAIDAICASGDVSQLDTRMRELKWNSQQRIALKTALGIVGAIA